MHLFGMPDFPYLIVGGGMTAAAAARGIREVDASGRIGILAAEQHKPYARPPLSKALWQGKPEESVWLELPQGVELLAGRRALQIDRQARRVRDDRGEQHGYGKLLLATGGAPRRLPFGEGVIYFRAVDGAGGGSRPGGERRRRGRRIAAHQRPRHLRRRRRGALFQSGAGKEDPRRTRGRRQYHGRSGGPRHGRRESEVRPPAVLLFGSLRSRVRGGGRDRRAPSHRQRVEDALPRRHRILPTK